MNYLSDNDNDKYCKCACHFNVDEILTALSKHSTETRKTMKILIFIYLLYENMYCENLKRTVSFNTI